MAQSDVPWWSGMEELSSKVAHVLARTGAQLARAGTVGRGLSVAEWNNRDNYARYDGPDHHTVSVYLAGGECVVREDRDLRGGAPDKLCLLPAGHESRWLIGGPLRMFHLYVDPEELAHQAVTAFDVDPRCIQLHDATFCDDPAMAAVVRGALMPLDWAEPGDRSALDAACHLLLHSVLRRHIDKGPGEVRAGLSPSARRRITDLVEVHLDEALTLDRLAAEARLSVFHFAKMFRISFGMPPHRYLAARRIERAKRLLQTQQPLGEVALACGYGSQSHFNRTFKAATQRTPGEWRRWS